MAARFTQAAVRALEPVLDPEDDSVWLIRRVDLDLSVNAAWEEERVTSLWAERLATQLAQIVARGGDGVNVVRFRSRADYVAAYLSAVSGGGGDGDWLFSEFEGLRALPMSRRIRGAIARDPGVGAQALGTMVPRKLRRIIGQLTESDARETLRLLTLRPGSGAVPRAALAVWRGVESLGPGGLVGSDAHACLLLVAAATQRAPELAGAALKAGSLAIVRLLRHLRRGTTDDARRISSALTAAHLPTLVRLVGPEEADVFAPLTRWRAADLEALFQWARPRNADFAAEDPATEVQSRWTPWGGIFLLLPTLATLPLAEATREWPTCSRLKPETVLRFSIALRCLGESRFEAGFADPLLRELFSIPETLTHSSIAAWQSGLPPTASQELAAAVLEWLRDRGLPTNEDRLVAPLDSHEGTMAVVIEPRRGMWIALEPMSANASGREPSAASGQPGVLDGVRAQLPRLAADVAYLLGGAPSASQDPFECTVACAAQCIVRSFAGSLPGFANASLGHLWSNFLDLDATLREEPDRRVVELGRPPLDLLLGVTGLSRQRYTLPWLDDGRAIHLFPGDTT